MIRSIVAAVLALFWLKIQGTARRSPNATQGWQNFQASRKTMPTRSTTALCVWRPVDSLSL
eukprot:4612125-Lingulodinium_polyedra.AAC.1